MKTTIEKTASKTATKTASREEITVRLIPREQQQLDALAGKLGMSPARLASLALAYALDKIETGEVSLIEAR
jgi:hypothetical protein